MKTIMIVDEDSEYLTNMQIYAAEENIDIIHAKNSRHGLATLNENPNVQLVLVNTICPETNTPAYFPIKPSANLKTEADKATDFLQKPFSKEQFKTFVEQKI